MTLMPIKISFFQKHFCRPLLMVENVWILMLFQRVFLSLQRLQTSQWSLVMLVLSWQHCICHSAVVNI